MAYTYELDTRLAQERTSIVSNSTGRFVRVFTVVGLAVYAAFAVTTLIVVPGAVQSPVVWAPLAMTVAVAGITFLVGHRLQRF
jgi:uncharacterized membrane protein YfbV (UPF0208 family)